MTRTESSYGWLIVPDPVSRQRVAAVAAARAVPGFEAIEPAAGSLEALEEAVLVRGYVSNPRPAYTRLPFDYRRVPPTVRAAGLVLLERVAAHPRGSPFPEWPVEPRLDQARRIAWAAAASELGVAVNEPEYAGGARGAILLTHDIDSRADIGRLEGLRALEREHGLVSSVGFVPRGSWPDRRVLDDLLSAGCEVYCHDIAHDGKLPYLRPDAQRRAFERFFEQNPDLVPLLRGFRSGQLLMSASLLEQVGGLFDYDLSIPDTERGGPYGPHAGCATVYPFLVGGTLLEIPLTIPQDFYLEHVERLTGEEVLAAWRGKLERVVGQGGVAVVNTHPVWVNRDRPAMWRAYQGLLETIATTNAWVTTGSELRTWLMAQRDGHTDRAVSH